MIIFFGKALDKVRPGGIIAFITSKYTLDRRDSSVRKYIAQRAELLCAVRLPAGAFKDIANTEVTSDILFLKKRDKELVWEKDWVHLGMTENNVPVNEYYINHPENMLGEMEFCKNMYGNENDTACINKDSDFDLISSLNKVFTNSIPKNIYQAQVQATATVKEDVIPADPNVKNYTFTIVDDCLYYRDNDEMHNQKEITGKKLERIEGMCEIRSALMDVINMQTKDGYTDEDLQKSRNILNQRYDSFIEEYGFLNNRPNNQAFKEDTDRPLLQSLERETKKDVFIKNDIFYKRTINPELQPVIETVTDALAASLNQHGRINLEYMVSLYPKSVDDIIAELGDKIYFDPDKSEYVTAEEYLSGNVKEKLDNVRSVLDERPELKRNEIALLKAQPERLSIADISFDIGSPWIPLEKKEQFIYDLLKIPRLYYRPDKNIGIKYDKFSNRYTVFGKPIGMSVSRIAASEIFGTSDANAFQIIEDCLNLKTTTVYNYYVDDDGNKKRELMPEATQIARGKQQQLQSEFQAWISNSPDTIKELEDIYNDRFNIYVPRRYDGSFLKVPGMSNQVIPRPHQLDAAARIFFGGNSLIAHEVGAGKTFSLAIGAMLKKHAGLSNKPLFVIPNHLIDQWTKDYYTIFPSANVLVTTKKDFIKENRKRFIARIATGDYDAVIMTYTQFERIPMSPEYRANAIADEVADIQAALSEADERDFTVKRLEKMQAQLEAKLEKLVSVENKDDTLYFEQLGVDALFVDEAHYYKNCYVFTRLSNIAGLGQSRAEKSMDILMKTKYLDQHTGYRGVVFATGTPVTNSLSEMFVMQRFIQNNVLEASEITQFDDWAGSFATIENVLEIAPEGTGFRDRSRFTKFNNLPELITMFHQNADIKLIDELQIERPELVGGKPEVIVVTPSDYVQEIIGQLAVEAEKVRNGHVDPSENNMLLITTKGRNVAIDPRLVDPSAPVDRDSKIYAACDNIVSIYHEYNDDKALQTVFLDVGMQLYQTMKDDLVQQGIPSNEIAFIHDANSDKQKAELFEKCRSGEIRVLFGSTPKMGAGTNIQARMIALHDVDCGDLLISPKGMGVFNGKAICLIKYI